MDEWSSQRNAAQVLLGAYGRSVVDTLPEALEYLLRSLAPGENRDAFVFGLAVALDTSISGQEDPITGERMMYPMGRDIVYAAIAAKACATREHIAKESNLCVKSTYVLTELGKSRTLRQRESYAEEDHLASPVDAVVHTAESLLSSAMYKQIVLPMVFGGRCPITSQDVAAIAPHFPEDEDRCMKCINAYSTAAFHGEAAHGEAAHGLTLNPFVALTEDAFVTRVQHIAEQAPGLLLRALMEAGFMGPQFFRSRRMNLPQGVAYPFGGKCLPFAFAEWYVGKVERSSPKKSLYQAS